ncbi:hypothetical protein [Sneathiella chinensis]|uniref:Uncharacterized protein n=1 Tax=Sneathiella chinensis TaxID=349750 RepID=A0ABQ5U6X6_9PROT|nr:hypothetical protein [Sneathiella chinensis]GLQ07014.1 hypothetical protein GCM10007924_22350 [Sneathiella chinensis]
MGKVILEYGLWTMGALLLGIGYMYLVLGSAPEVTNTLSFFISKIYFIGLFHVGGIIGSILAITFILFDALYLKRKSQPSKPRFTIRAISMLLILVILGASHYLLEKVFDVL